MSNSQPTAKDLKDWDLSALEKRLEQLSQELKDARSQEEAYRRLTTEKLNRLNEVQKAIDLRIDNLKAIAPIDTDWKSGRRNRVAEI